MLQPQHRSAATSAQPPNRTQPNDASADRRACPATQRPPCHPAPIAARISQTMQSRNRASRSTQAERTVCSPAIQVESRQKENAAARSLRTPRVKIRIVLKPNPSFALLRNFAPAGCRQPPSCLPAWLPCPRCSTLPTATTRRRAPITLLELFELDSVSAESFK